MTAKNTELTLLLLSPYSKKHFKLLTTNPMGKTCPNKTCPNTELISVSILVVLYQICPEPEFS